MRRRWLTWWLLAALAMGTLSACGGEGDDEGEGVPNAPLNEGGEGEGEGEDD